MDFLKGVRPSNIGHLHTLLTVIAAGRAPLPGPHCGCQGRAVPTAAHGVTANRTEAMSSIYGSSSHLRPADQQHPDRPVAH